MKTIDTHMKGGYIGILVLLITFLIIAFLLVRPDVLSGNTKTKSTLQVGIDAVEKAKEVTVPNPQQQIPDELLNEQ